MKTRKLLKILSAIPFVVAPITCLQITSCTNGDFKLTFSATEGGTITSSTTLTTKEAKWKDISKPTYETQKGYEFKGWKYKNVFLDDEFTITNSMDIVAVFAKTDATSLKIEGESYIWVGSAKKYKAIIDPVETALTPTWSVETPEGSTAHAFIDQEGNLIASDEGELIVKVELDDDYHTTSTFTVNAIEHTELNESIYQFYTDDWSEVLKYTANFNTFKAHYTGFYLSSQLIGLVKPVRINGVSHLARIIGVNHDKLSEPNSTNATTAFLTFEMQSVVSDENGHQLICYWGGGDPEQFTNGTLYKNLNSLDEEVEWYDYLGFYSTKYTKSCLAMLMDKQNGEPALAEAIKTVVKETAAYDSTSGEYVAKDANIKLFPLSKTEQCLPKTLSDLTEGKAYDYWTYITTVHTSEGVKRYRLKGDANGAVHHYWTRTKHISSEWVWIVTNTGREYSFPSSEWPFMTATSFAFCI